ncbi:GNAT family N-acetyltransferase [Iodobacter sp.]|uniref:GNAT family N-acetyltransferase n=1 Tax=Iodobacter sp. TaxID=1915058 RepID=UPI0025CFFBEC|nr:GNAT family N-acetyltransferase [Iodobacter sp.]
MPVKLVTPNLTLLPSYLAALERYWTPNHDRDPAGARQLLDAILRDPATFLASLSNPEGKGSPIVLEDGTAVPRLPFTRYWISDGEYAGEINLRWQLGTSELPAYCLGHIGYAVVPWKRNAGYASLAIRQLLPIAHKFDLKWLDISMAANNIASRRTAEKAGAILIKEFNAGAEYGNVDALLYQLPVHVVLQN